MTFLASNTCDICSGPLKCVYMYIYVTNSGWLIAIETLHYPQGDNVIVGSMVLWPSTTSLVPRTTKLVEKSGRVCIYGSRNHMTNILLSGSKGENEFGAQSLAKLRMLLCLK